MIETETIMIAMTLVLGMPVIICGSGFIIVNLYERYKRK